VDADYRPVPAGVASHTTLLTNLANRAQPLIRYDLGDSITWAGTRCRCGSEFPALRVEGRCDEVLRIVTRGDHGAASRTVKLLPLIVTTVLEEQGGVHDFQLVQEGAALSLRLGGDDAARAPQALAALRQWLETQGSHDVPLRHAGAPCRSARSGKLQRVCVTETQCSSTKPSAAG
jgi:phenylacetate-coenzyme A ligase PaaK-like adenylate-forming protein